MFGSMRVHRLGAWMVYLATIVTALLPGADVHAQTLWDHARNPALRNIDEDLARGRSLLDAARRIEFRTPETASALRERLVREAHSIFANTVARAPTHVAGLLGLAESLEALQSIDEARVVRTDRHGGSLGRDDRYAQALALLERAEVHVGEGPELPDVLFRLGVLNTRRQRFTAARDAYLRFVTLALPSQSRATGLCNLAETYVYLMDLERAVRTYNDCLAVEPGNAAGWWGLANATDRDGRAGEAHEAAVQALAEDPELRDLIGPHVFYVPAFDRYYYLGLAREAAGRTTEALAAWHRYLDDGGAGTPWADRARAHITRLELLAREPSRNGRRSSRR